MDACIKSILSSDELRYEYTVITSSKGYRPVHFGGGVAYVTHDAGGSIVGQPVHHKPIGVAAIETISFPNRSFGVDHFEKQSVLFTAEFERRNKELENEHRLKEEASESEAIL